MRTGSQVGFAKVITVTATSVASAVPIQRKIGSNLGANSMTAMNVNITRWLAADVNIHIRSEHWEWICGEIMSTRAVAFEIQIISWTLFVIAEMRWGRVSFGLSTMLLLMLMLMLPPAFSQLQDYDQVSSVITFSPIFTIAPTSRCMTSVKTVSSVETSPLAYLRTG